MAGWAAWSWGKEVGRVVGHVHMLVCMYFCSSAYCDENPGGESVQGENKSYIVADDLPKGLCTQDIVLVTICGL